MVEVVGKIQDPKDVQTMIKQLHSCIVRSGEKVKPLAAIIKVGSGLMVAEVGRCNAPPPPVRPPSFFFDY